MDERYELADENEMSHEFVDWFFDEKKAACGNAWFMMMAAMWEGWKGRGGLVCVTVELSGNVSDVTQGIQIVIF
jgi:hypothetical protein